MESGKALIVSVKILLMSSGILSIAILLSMTMPNLLTSATSDLPSFFSTLRSWLRPPYLCVIINAIILTIVASSRLHASPRKTPPPLSQSHHPHQHDVISVRADLSHVAEAVVESVVGGNFSTGFEYDVNDVVSVKDVEADERERTKGVAEDKEVVVKEIRNEPTVVERSTWTTPPPPPTRSSPLMRQQPFEKASPEFFSERPPAYSRFGRHRRPDKATTTEGNQT